MCHIYLLRSHVLMFVVLNSIFDSFSQFYVHSPILPSFSHLSRSFAFGGYMGRFIRHIYSCSLHIAIDIR